MRHSILALILAATSSFAPIATAQTCQVGGGGGIHGTDPVINRTWILHADHSYGTYCQPRWGRRVFWSFSVNPDATFRASFTCPTRNLCMLIPHALVWNTFTVSLPIPNDPSLVGKRLAVQIGCWDGCVVSNKLGYEHFVVSKAT